MKHSDHLLYVGCRTAPPRRVSAGCAPSGLALHLREHQGVGAAHTSSATRTLVSKIVFHMKGARRASICSWVSGDIGVDAVDPPKMCADRNLVMVGEMPVERSVQLISVALPGTGVD
jgi:hypothetical protein